MTTADSFDHRWPAAVADGFDPRTMVPPSKLSVSAAFASDDETLPASLELDPILSDLAADVDDVWRASRM